MYENPEKVNGDYLDKWHGSRECRTKNITWLFRAGVVGCRSCGMGWFGVEGLLLCGLKNLKFKEQLKKLECFKKQCIQTKFLQFFGLPKGIIKPSKLNAL